MKPGERESPVNGSGLAPAPLRSVALSIAQKAIVDLVRTSPGCTIQDIAEHCKCSHPTAAYHLTMLTRRGVVRRHRDGRAVRHYVAAAGALGELQYLAALERDERRRQIIQFLRTQDLANLSINQMRARLGFSYGLIKRTLLQLERQGLIALRAGSYTYQIELRGPLAKDGDAMAALPLAVAPPPRPADLPPLA